MIARVREAFSQRRIWTLLALVALLVVMALIVRWSPRPVAGIAALGQCSYDWPVLAFEGESWKRALPDALGSYSGEIPIAQWPSGMSYDVAAGALLDSSGEVLFRDGDEVRVVGSLVEVHGDPSPCYFTLGVRVEEIASP
jgi:hypothetical protein